MTVFVIVAAAAVVLALAWGLVLLLERWTMPPDQTEQETPADEADDGP